MVRTDAREKPQCIRNKKININMKKKLAAGFSELGAWMGGQMDDGRLK